eukprot:CAMPEP_0116135840 /NCGR_PEP_ID=MMETSP0329-20121206/11407_1 /TAXON_ID=697910 /ORGANISM="Pseudo-nitzschia arenysensis, Strain B593" /LENGTH=306 /DNA_ID=CAMNT_0003630671 /DNA_START=115 /DNA_END=1035 /DNA_ORIENTATION=+
MTSLLRPSAKSSSEAMVHVSELNEPASFHDSTFFKVLGRIDEETSFRTSLSNMTSQDSSPRSMNSSGDSEVTDWLTPLSPENFGNINLNEKQLLHGNSQTRFGSNSNSNSNIIPDNKTQNITVVATITEIEDRKIETVTAVERRQDRSSPTLLKSQISSISPSNSVSSLQSSLSETTRDHSQHGHEQHLPKVSKDDEQLRKENLALQRECEELEAMVLKMKTDGNILQVRTAFTLKNYRAEIERATMAKESLQTQCRELEDKILSLRTETRLQQDAIWDAEKKLRSQTKKQQKFGNKKLVSATRER